MCDLLCTKIFGTKVFIYLKYLIYKCICIWFANNNNNNIWFGKKKKERKSLSWIYFENERNVFKLQKTELEL